METSRGNTPRLVKIQQRSSTDLAARVRESELEHQQLHTAQERQWQLEAQALRRLRDLEQQASIIAHEREVATRELPFTQTSRGATRDAQVAMEASSVSASIVYGRDS